MTGLFTLSKLALIAAVVGAVDWLLIGLFKYNFIADLFGSGTQPVTSMGQRIIYVVFGAGGIIALPLLAAGVRHAVTARTDRSVEHGDYGEYRDFLAWKAEKAQMDAAQSGAKQTAAEPTPAPQDETRLA